MEKCYGGHESPLRLHVQSLVQLVTILVQFQHHQSLNNRYHELSKYGYGLSYSEFFYFGLHLSLKPKSQLQQIYLQMLDLISPKLVYEPLDDQLSPHYESLHLLQYLKHLISSTEECLEFRYRLMFQENDQS